jgi:hypothetical protein
MRSRLTDGNLAVDRGRLIGPDHHGIGMPLGDGHRFLERQSKRKRTRALAGTSGFVDTGRRCIKRNVKSRQQLASVTGSRS